MSPFLSKDETSVTLVNRYTSGPLCSGRNTLNKFKFSKNKLFNYIAFYMKLYRRI